MGKLGLYWYTIKSLKYSQVYYRIRKVLKLKCTIGCQVSSVFKTVSPIFTMEELDFDTVFLERFDVEELMRDEVTLLHSTKKFTWDEEWAYDDKSALWNFNLHYFEFLFALVKAYRDSADESYFEKSKYCIDAWIRQNPQSRGGYGWSPYTIDLRLTNWLSYYSELKDELDEGFKKRMLESIHEQYAYLSQHLEKDLLGNHYFEDLKALILCAIFFNDEPMIEVAVLELKKQCKEQILSDGMHFELSLMYHKIIFENLLRISHALRMTSRQDVEIESYLQSMLNVTYSFEEGLDRVPLFNDSGNNVAKSMDALVRTSKRYFGLQPHYKSQFADSGYYIFKQDDWKLIVDAGQLGPRYISGHGHCDAMSFELFKAGKPILVNCGTYAYQCKEREFFRSTAAHNTVMVEGTEQSQCWGIFRVAKRGKCILKYVDDDRIEGVFTDYKGNSFRREITIIDGVLQIVDYCGGAFQTIVHFTNNCRNIDDCLNISTPDVEKVLMKYAPEYGKYTFCNAIIVKGYKKNTKISFDIKGVCLDE